MGALVCKDHDIGFELGRIHGGYHGRVACAASRLAIRARIAASGRGAASRRRVRGLLGRYRRALDGLVAKGLLTSEDRYYRGNCRPAWCAAEPATACCMQPSFCPSCWARRAADLWSRVDAAVYPDVAAGPACGLVYVVRRIPSPALTAYGERDAQLRAAIDERCRDRAPAGGPGLIGSRSRERYGHYRQGVLWVAESLVFDLELVDDRVRWRAEVRQLLAIPHDLRLIALRAGDRLKALAAPTRGQVAQVVAALGRYPRHLLVDPRGDGRYATPAPALADYMAAVRRRQLWSSSGLPRAGRALGPGGTAIHDPFQADVPGVPAGD